MRKRLKTLELQLSMLANRDVEKSQRVIKCDNVRVKQGRLSSVGLPEKLEIMDADGMTGGRLFAVVDSDVLGRIGLFDSVGGGNLGYALLDGNRRIKVLAPSPGDVTDAMMLNRNLMVIMSPSGLMYASVGKTGLDWIGRETGYPDLKFEIYDSSLKEVAIAGRKLSGVYGAESSRLNSTDSATMIKDARGAMTAIMNEAAQRGRFAQGVLARYRLRDQSGRTLFTSVPVLLSHSLGLSFSGEYSAIMASDYKSYEAWKLQAGEFMVRLRMPDDTVTDWRGMVHDVVVEMSCPVHPFGSDTGSVCELRSRANGGMSVLYRSGGSVSHKGDSVDRASGVVDAMLSAGDKAFATVAVISSPMERVGQLVDINPPIAMSGDIDSQLSAIAALSSSPEPVLNSLESLMYQPHLLGATTASRCGDNVVWGDITIGRYGGVPAGILAAESVNEPWEGSVTTEFSDRSHITIRCKGENHAPVSLLPMVSYPSADAVKITIKVKRGGKVCKGEYSLHEIAGGRYSIWLSSDSCYNILEPSTEELDEVNDSGREVEMSGAVAVTHGSDRGKIVAMLPSASSGRVIKLVEMPRRSSAWEGGMLRVYMFSSDGVSVVSTNDSGNKVKVQTIDRRGVSNRRSVTVNTQSGCLVAIAGGDLVNIDRSRVVTMIPGIGESEVAWDEADRELWVVNLREGFPRVIPDCGDTHYRLTSLSAGRMWSSSSGLIVEDDEANLLDCSLGRVSGITDIHWEMQVEAPLHKESQRPMALSDCIVELRGKSPNPRMDLLVASSASELRKIPEIVKPADEPRHLVAGMALRGKVVITTRLSGLMAPPRRWVWLRFTGDVDSSMEMYMPRLVFGK